MCRLFLYLSNNTSHLPRTYLEKFIEIAREGLSKKCGLKPHSDGFGIAWVNENGYGVYKSLKPIWNEKIHLPPAKLFLLHARKAGVGGVSLSNTHPFVKRNIILAHNGNIYGFSREASRYYIEGKTDSERYLALLATFMEYYEDFERSFMEVLRTVDLATALNMIVISLEERKVIVSNIFFKAPKGCPSYYVMWMKRTNGELLISSEPLDDNGWEELSKEPGELTIVTINIDDMNKISLQKTKLRNRTTDFSTRQ